MYQLLRWVLSAILISLPYAHAQNLIDEGNSTNLIVGGFSVSIEQVPYQAAVLHEGILMCGGTIIGLRWIVTSSHCVQSLEPSEYQIVVGSTDPQNGDKLSVEMIFAPPYIINGSLFDIALVKLRKDLVYNEAVQCVPLLQSEAELVFGKPAYVSGYGASAEGSYERKLKAANVNLLPARDCENAYGRLIQPHMICAGFQQGQVDSCQGDSGGPLVLGGKLAGVIFYGVGCAQPNFPGVYMSIPWFYDWIVNIVREQSRGKQLCDDKKPK